MKSIINDVATILTKAEHMHYARDIYALWHKTYKGYEMKLLFWKIVKAFNEDYYNDALDELAKGDEAAAEAFKKYNPKLLCRAFLSCITSCDVVRTKYILYMLEDIRTSPMQNLILKRQVMEKSSDEICLRIRTKLEKEKAEAVN